MPFEAWVLTIPLNPQGTLLRNHTTQPEHPANCVARTRTLRLGLGLNDRHGLSAMLL